MNLATLVDHLWRRRRCQTTRRRSQQRRDVAFVDADVKVDVARVALDPDAQAAHRRWKVKIGGVVVAQQTRILQAWVRQLLPT